VSLRLAAALALILGAAALLAFARQLGQGPFASLEASHLREMKERVDPPAHVTPITFADMAALPHGRPVGEYSAYERRGVALEGTVQHLLRANDGDLHLEIVARPLLPTDWDTTYVTAEITPRVRSSAPHWTYENLVQVFRPRLGGVTPWPQGTRRVRVTGWLLYDWQYDAPWSGPRKAGDRLTGWEIHPVTRIEAWDERTPQFAEVPR